jgi:hypothetical protein
MRTRISHTSVIAYLALFLALGGTGFAAQQIAQAAKSPPVKVRCSASRSGRRVACAIVRGKGVGPRGAQGVPGKPGAPGAPGAAGSTALTAAPSYTPLYTQISNPLVGVNNISSDPTGQLEWQRMNVYSGSVVSTPATVPFETFLLSPNELDGSADHISSVDFCYGIQDSTIGSATLSITRLTVIELTEPDGPANGAQPVYTTPPAQVFDQPVNLGGSATGQTNCVKVAASGAPVAIAPGGYLALKVQLTFAAPTAPKSYNQGWVYFGRISTTYSPS